MNIARSYVFLLALEEIRSFLWPLTVSWAQGTVPALCTGEVASVPPGFENGCPCSGSHVHI